MIISRIVYILYICCSICFTSYVEATPNTSKTTFNEDEILLLDIKLNEKTVARSIESYPAKGRTLVAVEPLFDALKVKYHLYSDRLIVWREGKEYIFALTKAVTNTYINEIKDLSEAYWATDDFLLFLDTELISRFFDAEIEVNPYRLLLEIKTQDNHPFPIQKIAILEQQRALAAAYAKNRQKDKTTSIPTITLEDQYRLFTIPHGRLSGSILWNEQQKDSTYSVQLTSDLLYHSANLTMSQSSGEDLSSRLYFSRYKTSPDKRILGAFDHYNWGDISGFSNNLTTTASSGLGVNFYRQPLNFRRRNQAVTLEEVAPPGWEAELFHNNRYLMTAVVPGDGLLIFEDIPTEYGNNYFEIKLYGPYGEFETIDYYYNLRSNSLSSGAVAYGIYAFDTQHQMINDKNKENYTLTNFGGTFDYGVSDIWQIGVGIAAQQQGLPDARELFSLKNSLSFPGILIENDTSINNDGGYAQLTSILGNGYANQRFVIEYQSANDYISSRLSSSDAETHDFRAGYSGTAGLWSYGFTGSATQSKDAFRWQISNRLSRSFHELHFSHSINYSELDNQVSVGVDEKGNILKEKEETSNITGSMGLSGKLAQNVRVSGTISYAPKESNPIAKSSSMTIYWSPKFWDIGNYFSANYYPLIESSNKWRISHLVAWDSKHLQYTFSSSYNAQDQWSLSAGIRFFLGYDHHNERPIFRAHTPSSSATLNTHAYLDRQMNGVYDPLDYNLPDVEFNGSPEWQGLNTGQSGRAILPGVPPNGPFYFGAKWKKGTETINKNYVVYAHPGARIDVNLPFQLNSEIIGFVIRKGSDQPIANAKITLSNEYLSREASTDLDGYFEFTGLPPGEYQVRISSDYLKDKGYTSDIVGYSVSTLWEGGFIELSQIELRRKLTKDEQAIEAVVPFVASENNAEAIVKEENKLLKRNYFTLPVKAAVKKVYTFEENNNQKHDNESRKAKEPSANKRPVKATELLPVLKTDSKNKTKNSKTYTIQLSALKTKEKAILFIRNLKALPISPEIEESVLNGKPIYRVILGDFKSRQLAKAFSKENLKGLTSYIRERVSDEQ